jgi:hypothetical protein
MDACIHYCSFQHFDLVLESDEANKLAALHLLMLTVLGTTILACAVLIVKEAWLDHLLCARLERERTDDMRAQLERMAGLMEKVRQEQSWG